jgi:kynureninase
MTIDFGEAYAVEQDRADDLAAFRDEFYINKGVIYLDGNSLGLACRPAESALLKALESWKAYGIDGWTSGDRPWFYTAERLGERLAPLVGAHPDEVIATGSITVNIHQLLATFYRPSGHRTKLLADELDFPTDAYAMQSQVELHGYPSQTHLIEVPSRDGRTLEEDDVIAHMSEEVAVILLPAVLYRSGQLLDIPRLTTEAHARGILIGFDLAHSVGSVPHALHDWGVDFAVWCNYKHLNGGPGAVGGLYVHRQHLGGKPGLAGWFSSDKLKQFDMSHKLTPAKTAGAFQMGTPHLFSSAPLLGALELFERAGIGRIRTKSLRLTDYLMALAERELIPHGFAIVNPVEHARRGGHVCLEHDEGARIAKSMKAHGVVPDFREPNVIRVAPVALYTSYREVWEAIQRIRSILESKDYLSYENRRDEVA